MRQDRNSLIVNCLKFGIQTFISLIVNCLNLEYQLLYPWSSIACEKHRTIGIC